MSHPMPPQDPYEPYQPPAPPAFDPTFAAPSDPAFAPPESAPPTTPFPAYPPPAPPASDSTPPTAPFPPQPYAPLPYEPQPFPGPPVVGKGHGPVGHPQPQPFFPPQMGAVLPTSGWSVAAMVLGIIGLLIGWCTFAVIPLLAIVFGHIGLAETRGNRKSGRGMAIAGLVMGYLVFVPTVLLIVLGGIDAFTGGFGTSP